jgi:hypothetical protein
MKPFYRPIIAALAASIFPLQAQNLVTNGDFETGGNILGASPFAWNSTVGPEGTGQFNPVTLDPPSPAPSAPLIGTVAYMNTGTQVFQTFAGVKLQPNSRYLISFDAYFTVGFVDETYPNAWFLADVSYGTGSGATSAFGGYIQYVPDIKSGATANWVDLRPFAQTFTHSFTTNSIEEGFVGSASDIAIYMQPGWGPNVGQAYIDNVSLTAIPEPSAALLGGLGLLGLLRRRR